MRLGWVRFWVCGVRVDERRLNDHRLGCVFRKRSTWVGRLVALAYTTIRPLGCYFHVLQGCGIQERQGTRKVVQDQLKNNQSLKPEKETTLFYHNTHNGSIPL